MARNKERTKFLLGSRAELKHKVKHISSISKHRQRTKFLVSSKAELKRKKQKIKKLNSGGFESLNYPTMAKQKERPKIMVVSSKAELKHKDKRRKKSNSGGFESLKLSYKVYKAIKRKGYIVPTPIQRQTMPLILSGADVVAMARTGSGKTAAFLIPMLEKLRQHIPRSGIRALILSPTRDLALQTFNFTRQLGRYTDLRTSLLVGGDSMESQFEELAQNPDIVIATPGRLMHHLSEVDDMSLRTVEYVVFDEADSLFGMGFAEQLHIILTKLSENRQTLLFSATMPRALADFAKAGLQDPQIVRLDVENRISQDCELLFFTLRPEEKLAALVYLIREQINPNQQMFIFVSTRYHAEFLEKLLALEGIESNICYGKMDPEAHKINLSKFRSGKIKVLIVTDVASNGIDIPLLDHVINWDFPSNPKLFVNRVGRVARAGRTGIAYSFVTPEDMPYLLDLHLFLARVIKPAPTEEEVLKDIGVMDKIDHAMANGVTIYGRFPQTVLDLVQDKVRAVIDSSADLQSLQKSCINGFRKYSKSKHLTSKESIRRVNYLPREGLHPIFKGVLEGNELTALAFAERLKSFRPKQTILEAEGQNALSKRLQGSASKWVDVMKKKRAIHEQIINKVHQKCLSDQAAKEEEVRPEIFVKAKGNKESIGSKRKAKSFRDEEYFISPVPTNQSSESGLSMRAEQGFGSNRLDSAVMDLVADDEEGMQKQKSVYHWDKKSKKYIKLNNGERVTVTGKVKTEGGRKVKAQKTGIYAKWKASTHNKIALKETDNEGHGPSVGLAASRFEQKFKGRNQQRSIPNAHVPSEIKDLEQIRKERQKKSRQASMKKNSRKGNKTNNVKTRKGK